MSEFNVFMGAIKSFPTGMIKMISTPFWSTMGAGAAAILAFTFGHESVAYAFAGLLVLDGITGWMKARKNGSQPDSRKLGEKTLAKLLIYLTPLLGWAFLEIMFEQSGIITPGALSPVRLAIIGWMGAREMLSILENLDTVCGDEYSMIRSLYNKIKGIEAGFAGKIDGTGKK